MYVPATDPLGRARARPNLANGTTLGRYELLRSLGAGGMAEVHLARSSGLHGFDKLVVVKRILPHLAADPQFIEMFLTEARLAALIDHPNVVQVYDLGTDGTDYFFTMEFVYGENLQTILRSATESGHVLPFEAGIGFCIDVAAGLHYAHERVDFDGRPLGIVHRDVSPSNVMVTYEGCAKVADFGIAKVSNRTGVTQAGIRKGKVPYMSPEQCRADHLDRRSDVFALGIVLFETTTLTRLFDGENEFGVMHRIVSGEIPRPSSRRAGYPPALEQIVMRSLAVDRDRRYPTTRALQLDLERFARDHRLNIGQSGRADWMHQVYRPQPFPWGALMGDGITGAPSLPTHVSHVEPVVESITSTPSQPHPGPVPAISVPPISNPSRPAREPEMPSVAPLLDSSPYPRGAPPKRGRFGFAIGVAAGILVVGGLGVFVGSRLLPREWPVASDTTVVNSSSSPVVGGEEPASEEPASVSAAESPSAGPNDEPPGPSDSELVVAAPDPSSVDDDLDIEIKVEPASVEEEPVLEPDDVPSAASDDAPPSNTDAVAVEEESSRSKPKSESPPSPRKRPRRTKDIDAFLPR